MSRPPIHIAALVSYNIYPAKMGGQKGIAIFYRYLSRLLPVTIISTKDNVPDKNERITFIPMLGNSAWRYINPLLFFSMRNFIKENNITHLILEHPYYGWLGILLKWTTKIKLIVHAHNIEALRFKSMSKWWWRILWYYEKFTHRQAHLSFFIHDDDRNYGIEKLGLSPQKCFTITYGIDLNQAPAKEERLAAKEMLCTKYGIRTDEKILLFNGTLDYKPNRDALDTIIEKINPLLEANKETRYKILICGNKLPPEYNGLTDLREKNIIYTGFVDDISLFFKGADIFINPVTEGGGIKTKVVEALGYDCSVISTHSGAIGIPLSMTGEKMKLIADNDWNSFASQVQIMKTGMTTPKDFFGHFYWGNIAAKAASLLNN